MKQIEIGFEYPRFRKRTLDDAASAVNAYIEAYAENSIRTFIDEAPEAGGPPSPGPWVFQSSFSGSLIRTSVVSVSFTMTSYTADAATWVDTVLGVEPTN